MRDRMLENWKYSESSDITHDFGSGKFFKIQIVRFNVFYLESHSRNGFSASIIPKP
jgi:hypothetical protein